MRPLTARCGCHNEKSGGANRIGIRWREQSARMIGAQRGRTRPDAASRGAPGFDERDA